MSERYTVRDVRLRFEALAKTAQEIGLDVSNWKLHEGSGTQGVWYRLYDGPRGALGLSQGRLGKTARDAYETLETMNGVLWALREAGKL